MSGNKLQFKKASVFIHLLKDMAQKNCANNTYLDCDGLKDSIVLIAVMTNIASLNQERFINVISATIKPHWFLELSFRKRNSHSSRARAFVILP